MPEIDMVFGGAQGEDGQFYVFVLPRTAVASDSSSPTGYMVNQEELRGNETAGPFPDIDTAKRQAFAIGARYAKDRGLRLKELI